MKKKIISLSLSLTMLLSSFNTAYANWYDTPIQISSDINADILTSDDKLEILTIKDFADLYVTLATYEHGEDPIKILKKHELIKDSDNFDLNSPITQGQAIKILIRSMNVNEDENYLDKAIEIGLINDKFPLRELNYLTTQEASELIANLNTIKLNNYIKKDLKTYEVEDFLKRPESTSYQLTRDGEYLVYSKLWEGKLNLFKREIATGVETQITKSKDIDINSSLVKDNTILYAKDFGGDENYHLFKTDENGNEVDLTPYENTRVYLLDSLENTENEILIQMNIDNKEVFSVYKLNVVTGDIQKVLDNNVGYSGFLTNNNNEITIATYNDGINSGYFYRETEDDEFELVKMYDYKDTISLGMFTEDNKICYALSDVGRNTTALVKVDVTTGEEVEFIYQHPDVDLMSAMSGKEKGTIGRITYVTDKMETVFFDNELEALQLLAEESIGNDDEVHLYSHSEDYTKAIFASVSDTNSGIFYLYDSENDTFEKLSDTNIIPQDDLAEMIPISYKSRDGLTIHGYLTLPKNQEPKNLPVIINPHGGPWARDFWGHNSEAQLFANRGYAVLQMNFRGSKGYGKEFLEAGFKQWGLKMQDDITDGVEWLIDIGVADPNRIGIYGGSYGGYATLSGITQTPDLYAAAVDYVGVSNLFTFLNTIPPYWENQREMMYEMVGHPERDKEQFEQTSPALNAHKIKTPLFIAQGANDPRVNKDESDQMVEALKTNGVEVDYMVKYDEGHGFAKYENQVDFYTHMIKFFDEHLGTK